jgi:hypothetical protein
LTLGIKQELYYDSSLHFDFTNYKDINLLIESYEEYWRLIDEHYDGILPISISINYKVIADSKVKELAPEKKIESKIKSKIKTPESLNKKEEKVKFSGFELPSTIDFTK